jgi:hypothetical protein
MMMMKKKTKTEEDEDDEDDDDEDDDEDECYWSRQNEEREYHGESRDSSAVASYTPLLAIGSTVISSHAGSRSLSLASLIQILLNTILFLSLSLVLSLSLSLSLFSSSSSSLSLR